MDGSPGSTEALIDRLVERSVEHTDFGAGHEFRKLVGAEEF